MDESYIGQILSVIWATITWSNFFALVGVFVCGLLALTFILVFCEWIVGCANAFSYIMWQRRTMIHNGVWSTLTRRWLLPWHILKESFHFLGYRNKGRTVYKSAYSGGYWRGIGDHVVHLQAKPAQSRTENEDEDEA